MKPSTTRVLSLLQSVLAIGLGVIAVMIVNLPAAPIVDSLFPGSVDPGGMPLTAEAQGAFLPILFLAGMAGAFLVVLVAPRAPVGHAVVFGALALVGDLFVVLEYAGIWPLWFSALVILTVPPQVWLGAVLGVRARRRWAPWRRERADVDAPAIRAERQVP
jgi:predicted alpha/beta hydrolase